MKVLLIIPTYKYTVSYPHFLSFSDFPIGFAYLASSLKKAGHQVYGLNLNNITGYPSAYIMIHDQITKKIQEIQPALIGLGGLCTDYKFLKDAMSIIRQAGKTPVVMGGGIVNNDAEYIFKLFKPDFAIIGEGEEVIVKLANEIDKAKQYQRIENLWYWHNGQPTFTFLRYNYGELDQRPFPDYEPFDIKKMVDNYSMATRLLYRYSQPYPRPFNLVASRSCPFTCLPVGTLILMSDMSQIPIERIRIGDEVIGVQKQNQWHYAKGKVTHTFSRRAMVYRIETEDGTTYSTFEHPWLMHERFLSLSDIEKSKHKGGKVNSERHSLRRLCTPIESKPATEDYKWGYLAGAIKGDGCFWVAHKTNGRTSKIYNHLQFRIVGDYEMLDRILLYGKDLGIDFREQRFNGGKLYKCNRSVTIQKYKEAEWLRLMLEVKPHTFEFVRGFMAGIYDAEGSCSGSLRISQRDGETKDIIEKFWASSGYKIRQEQNALRLLGGLSEIIKFFSWCSPSVIHKHSPYLGRVNHSSKILSYEFVGEQDVFNLETTLDTFIADGFVTHNCTFCCHHHRGIPYRARSIENIVAEIKLMYDEYKFNILILLDELFAVKKQQMIDFCKAILDGKKQYGWNFDWMFQTHASAKFDLETLKLAKESGCFFFSYGLESASPKVLESMNKKIKVSQVVEAIKMANEAKIGFGANIIFGDFAETEETFAESIAFWLEHGRANFIFCSNLMPYPGSKVFDVCIERGLIKDKLDYYETIDKRLINLTSLSNRHLSGLLQLTAFMETTWLFTRKASDVSYEEDGQNDLLRVFSGGHYYKIWANCPFCNERVFWRESIPNTKEPWFMGTGCPKCNRRIKVEVIT